MFAYLGAQDKWSKWLVVANVAILLFIWFFSVWRFWLSPDFIPLHYTVYFGFDRFGPRYDIFLFPSLATVIAAANFLAAKQVRPGRHLWHKLFLTLTFLMQATLLLSLILVVLKGLY